MPSCLAPIHRRRPRPGPFVPRALAITAFAWVGCGDETLTRPADLPITVYPAGQPFTLTLVMSYCRSSCERYEDASCDVSVDEDERRIRVSPEVEVERDEDAACTESCGGAAILAHCEVEGLDPGEWTVEATDGRFSRTITLR